MDAGIVTFAEALQIVLRYATQVRLPGVEAVALLESVGRVLAEPVVADRDQPPFDRATRDGFAVQAVAWTAGRRLRITGAVRAGEAWSGGLPADGEAIEIMTGAAVPTGADAVAMVEHGERTLNDVWALAGRVLRAGENIVRRGSEARAGAVLLAAGAEIGAAETAVAASCGCVELMVRQRPLVAVVATGDELVEVDGIPGERQIRNSNGYALAAMVGAAGGRAKRLKIARDTGDDLRERIAEGRACDLLVISGGVSAGKFDLVEDVLAEAGAEFFFTGVKMQPGRPTVFGWLPGTDDRHGTYFFGLPGNPVSTQVTFHCFVEPMLRAMCGAEIAGPRFVQATLAEEIRGKAGLTRLLPARMTSGLGSTEVRLEGWQGSGDIAANARANCYAVLPDGKDLRADDVISVLLR
jgi:molybdopterin molybdotransferase